MDFDVFWCKMKKRFCLFRFFSLLITFVELKTTKTSRVVKKSVLTRYFLQTRCHLFRFWKITIPVMMGSSISKYGTLFFGIAWKLLSYLSSWWPPIFSPNGAFYRLILQIKKMIEEWNQRIMLSQHAYVAILQKKRSRCWMEVLQGPGSPGVIFCTY